MQELGNSQVNPTSGAYSMKFSCCALGGRKMMKNKMEFTLVLEEDLTIKTAPKLKESLVYVLTSYEAITIKVKPPSQLDLTAMQLLMSARRHAKKMGKKLEIDFELPEEVSEMLNKAGFKEVINNL